ncbi:MAG: class I SAM-dependent methyltransferase [Candidatus Kapaibacterium sp.]
MNNFWDERFANNKSVYGEEPNQFFKEHLSKLEAGALLLPAEGEGRNAIFAAKTGWEVSAFDTSKVGRENALKRAQIENVAIDYKLQDILEFDYSENMFDAIGLVFAHFPSIIRAKFHQKLISSLRVGGYIILEGFSKNHLQFSEKNPSAGGPKNIDMLFDSKSILEDFSSLKTILIEEKIIHLSEGEFHHGESYVVRYVGKRI